MPRPLLLPTTGSCIPTRAGAIAGDTSRRFQKKTKLKHPELPVLMAEKLRQKGHSFVIDFYGSGEEEASTRALASHLGLEDCINFLGAVANESMSQGCVLVGSDAIGSIPFLVKHRQNGLVFRSCQVDSLVEEAEWLITHPQEMRRMQRAAVSTMQEIWSPRNAARQFLQLVGDLENGRECSVMEGPGSKE